MTATACPNCSIAESVVPIVYGMPTSDLAAEDGRTVWLAGCAREPDSPELHCLSCDHEW